MHEPPHTLGRTDVRALLVVLLTVACTGCLSQSSLDGFGLPSSAREDGRTFAVRHQPKDPRNLDRLIAEELRGQGLSLAAEAADADYVVTYVDRWYWDMRNYLIDLRIDVRDARTDVLVATGRSYQTSLAAMGETHQSVIERTVAILIDGATAEDPQRAPHPRPLFP